MNFYLLLIAILPVVLIGLFIYKKDKNKESTKLLFKLFGFGILSCFLVVIISLFLGIFFPILTAPTEELNLLELLLQVFIGVALIEEFCKWVITYKLTFKHDEFDEIYDIIIYSVFVSLGFTCFENILYVLEGGIVTGIIRALLAVPSHACFGIFMGYYLGLSKLSEISKHLNLKKKYFILSLLVPVILHGIYDYLLFTQIILFILIYFGFIILLYIRALRKIKTFTRVTTKLKYKNNYCPNCGRKVDSDYCPNCGNKNI